MKAGSLCTGIGGLDLAVEAFFGCELAWYAEIEPAPCTVLEREWPDVPNLRDLTTVDWFDVEPVDVLTAGFPCQPFSHAGQRRGERDQRHLWPYIAVAVRILRPRWVVLENVGGLLSVSGEFEEPEDRCLCGWPHRRRGSTSLVAHQLAAAAAAAADRWEKALAWRIFGSEAAAFLRRIEPHVVLKREQVRLALLIEDTRVALPKSATGKRSYWTEEAFARCMTLYRRIKELNRKGPAPVPPPPPPGSQMFAQLVAGSWVVAQADLFSELGSAPFSGTWPKRGSMRSGACFEHRTWEPPISGPESSSLQIEAMRLLPTPRTSDTNGPGSHGDGGPDLRTAVTLLPTPTARDWKDGDVRHLSIASNSHLGRVASRLSGDSTSPRSDDGSSSSVGQLPGQLTIGDALPPPSSSG